ncbi:MAG: hypothetical protein ACTSXW_07065 [Candidatus Baldrarchaeia archaeon]
MESLSSLRKQADKVFRTFYKRGCHFIYGVQLKTPICNLYFPLKTSYFMQLLGIV